MAKRSAPDAFEAGETVTTTNERKVIRACRLAMASAALAKAATLSWSRYEDQTATLVGGIMAKP